MYRLPLRSSPVIPPSAIHTNNHTDIRSGCSNQRQSRHDPQSSREINLRDRIPECNPSTGLGPLRGDPRHVFKNTYHVTHVSLGPRTSRRDNKHRHHDANTTYPRGQVEYTSGRISRRIPSPRRHKTPGQNTIDVDHPMYLATERCFHPRELFLIDPPSRSRARIL